MNHSYDRDALAMMAISAKEAMPGESEAIADKGYYKSEEIVACQFWAKSIVAIVTG